MKRKWLPMYLFWFIVESIVVRLAVLPLATAISLSLSGYVDPERAFFGTPGFPLVADIWERAGLAMEVGLIASTIALVLWGLVAGPWLSGAVIVTVGARRPLGKSLARAFENLHALILLLVVQGVASLPAVLVAILLAKPFGPVAILVIASIALVIVSCVGHIARAIWLLGDVSVPRLTKHVFSSNGLMASMQLAALTLPRELAQVGIVLGVLCVSPLTTRLWLLWLVMESALAIRILFRFRTLADSARLARWVLGEGDSEPAQGST